MEDYSGFRKKSEKIRAFQNKRNLGLVGNWNACIAKAEGTWIKFLFQDDTMVSSCLHDMISCAVESKGIYPLRKGIFNRTKCLRNHKRVLSAESKKIGVCVS